MGVFYINYMSFDILCVFYFFPNRKYWHNNDYYFLFLTTWCTCPGPFDLTSKNGPCFRSVQKRRAATSLLGKWCFPSSFAFFTSIFLCIHCLSHLQSTSLPSFELSWTYATINYSPLCFLLAPPPPHLFDFGHADNKSVINSCFLSHFLHLIMPNTAFGRTAPLRQ